jgi:hypothetical protein
MAAVALLLVVGRALCEPANGQGEAANGQGEPATKEQLAKVDLDLILDAPKCWDLTPAAFEAHFMGQKQGLFRWLTTDKTRAIFSRNLYSNVTIGLAAFGKSIPVEEAVVDFAGGRLNLVTVSLHNRGDAEDIPLDEFNRRYKEVGKAVEEKLAMKPSPLVAGAGLQTEGYVWRSRRGLAILECNVGATSGKPREFLRLRLARRDATGALAESMRGGGAAAPRLADLPRNLIKDAKGNVFIGNIPMVDQGNKAYCLPASIQRVFEYYGMGTDMHEIIGAAGSDPKARSSPMAMAKELDKIDFHFKTRLQILGLLQQGSLREIEAKRGEYFVGELIEEKKFLADVRRFIDAGIPVLWALQVGLFPEEPALKAPITGSSMRLIIGYNEQDQRLISTDPWGAGHEFKSMKYSDAMKATLGVFVLKPTVR